ncbi:MAG: site-specific integrase [endosymbiont of Seepiophila jonesi]|uniref:Site-specific integrase n=1 Tax=endosymbiont of Lamellibrachia luymesi TaxID=2200907 RepID=A0A370DUP5_9GAMM|nr:MAG: site-specific integrase [endosymbiont of Lamellibrachia luymesi]RDH94144.1 MAG: site-specific integrase [endosymbiont of Seepiophila jonesi]
MATKRQRGNRWEFIVRRKRLLEKPYYLTFDSEKEGDAYVEKLEALLDRGIVPEELSLKKPNAKVVKDLIKNYLVNVSIKTDEHKLLVLISAFMGDKRLTELNYDWAEKWVQDMKRIKGLKPGTIRHYVGAMARCMDWGKRKGLILDSPLRDLPRGYASYTDADALYSEKKIDGVRDRRLESNEEANIRAVMNGEKPEDSLRPLSLYYQGAIECVFDLAVETAMRLREIYTLELAQVSLKKRTIFLEKTKNGSKRQVPLSSVAMAVLKKYLSQVRDGDRGMGEFKHEGGWLFPWWDGDADSKALKKITSRISRQYSRVFAAAGCSDLRFHDLRHEATSRFFERTEMSDIEIAKITGHSDSRILVRYANLRASDLARKLW